MVTSYKKTLQKPVWILFAWMFLTQKSSSSSSTKSFSLPGCSLLKSRHHHHQQSHRNHHHQDQQLIVAEVFDREEGIVMPTVWAISIVHWLLLLQNSCTVLPVNQYQKCDSQFLLLHNYCHRPQAHTRCPTTTTTLLYIPEKSYMGPESVCREFSVTNHGCICIKLLFAWTPITAPVIHTFTTAKSWVQNYSCNGLDCLGLKWNLSPSSMYLQGQNYCMVLMLISTSLLPSCTPHRTPTLYVTKLWYWWFQHTRFIYLHFSFRWWCWSLEAWRSRTTTHKKLRHSVNFRLLCLFSSFKDNCCGMNMQRMPW